MRLKSHCANMPMHFAAICKGCKNDNFKMKKKRYLSRFRSKHRSLVHVRNRPTEVLTSEKPRSMFKRKNKLKRNKNARHIFPHHFFPVAKIGIICLHMHFVLYTLNTRSIFFKFLHYFRQYDNHCTKCTCTSCAATTRLF